MYRETDIISEIRKGRLRWLGHVERMPEERTVKRYLRISQKENGLLESQDREGQASLKKTAVNGCQEGGEKQLRINPEGGQSPTWTVQPVQREKKLKSVIE